MRLRNLALALLTTLTLHAADNPNAWTPSDTKWETTYQVVLLADFLQTLQISDRSRDPRTYRYYYDKDGSYKCFIPHCETNPMLGKFPTRKEVTVYFLESAASHLLISYLLPAKARTWWQGATIAIEVGYVAHNYGVGVAIKF